MTLALSLNSTSNETITQLRSVVNTLGDIIFWRLRISHVKIKSYTLPTSPLSLAEMIYLLHYSFLLNLAAESVSRQHYSKPALVNEHWHTRRKLFPIQALEITHLKEIIASECLPYTSNQRVVWVLKESWLNKYQPIFKLHRKYCYLLVMNYGKAQDMPGSVK